MLHGEKRESFLCAMPSPDLLFFLSCLLENEFNIGLLFSLSVRMNQEDKMAFSTGPISGFVHFAQHMVIHGK